MASFIEITPTLSNKIANVGFVCACLVVPIHLSHPQTGASAWLDHALAGGLSTIAVPMFFLISGFLLAGKVESSGWWKRELIKRVKSLLIPFYCWILIALVYALILKLSIGMLKGVDASELVGSYLRGINWFGALGFDMTAMPESHGHLWFVRNLLLLVVVSPLILVSARRLKWFLFGLLLVGVVIVRAMTPRIPDDINGFFVYGFSLTGLLFFSLGVSLRLWRKPSFVVASNKWVSVFIVTICIGAQWLAGAIGNAIIRSIVSVFATVLLSYAAWSIVPSVKWPKWLTSAAFPIYLMHGFFIGTLQTVPSSIPGTGTVVGFLIHWLVPIAGSICVATIIRKFAPEVAKVLFGGR